MGKLGIYGFELVEGIGDDEDEGFGMKGMKVGLDLGLLKGQRYWIMERIDDERDKIWKRRLSSRRWQDFGSNTKLMQPSIRQWKIDQNSSKVLDESAKDSMIGTNLQRGMAKSPTDSTQRVFSSQTKKKNSQP